MLFFAIKIFNKITEPILGCSGHKPMVDYREIATWFWGVPATEGMAELDQIAPGSLSAIFRDPARQGAISAWWGHVPFAHWLMHVARPRLVVELGTHNGVSYAAFCSSVEAERLTSRCCAVDTWEGDHQAGQYDGRVLEDLRTWHDASYSKFSTLMRCTFDEAAPRFKDGSIDLLHIDGLHTYEAVRHDFETWLPKLSPSGIVLMHDTEEQNGDFGVWRLWEELRNCYPSFNFRHSHGLGLLAIGRDAPLGVLGLCAIQDFESVEQIEALFALLGRKWSVQGELIYQYGQTAELRDAAARQRDEYSTAIAEVQASHEKIQLEATQVALAAEKAREEARNMRIERDNALRELDVASLDRDKNAADAREAQMLYEQMKLDAVRCTVAADSAREETRLVRLEWDAAKAEMDAVTGSLIWRMTQPLRIGLTYTKNLQIVRAIKRKSARGSRSKFRKIRQRIMSSGLFDATYYLAANPDVAKSGSDPLSHFLLFGWREARDPSPHFSVSGYLARYEDVRAADANPLVHYLLNGQQEGRHAVSVSNEKLMAPPSSFQDRDAWLIDIFQIVPYYINPYVQFELPVSKIRLAVHIHVYYDDLIPDCINYLCNIPVSYDLFVSVPKGRDIESVSNRLKESLTEVKEIFVEEVPNRGRDIAPLIVQFGHRLLTYDAIAHFHTKKSPHNEGLKNWFNDLMKSLCGSRSGVMQILDLLARDAKVIYSVGHPILDSGWNNNHRIASRILSDIGMDDFTQSPHIEFPQGSMFWARTSSISSFLTLSLSYDDFPEEPIASDGTIAHALERLILLVGLSEPGRNYRLENPAWTKTGPLFEAKQNFLDKIKHDTVKFLAYYLPQFHATPENDAWHGFGFTEWYKVRSANALFQNHYQQHIPHPDIGYYSLESADQMRRQALMMKEAGIHGMIFYHYWFAGRLILEKPAKLLLSDASIRMPFCFCWANENWTRRWDGNEQEILLAQVYSPQDAKEFIHYLIPFFEDDRYIKIDGRPVLLVYRPSSIPVEQNYVEIWRCECEVAGLPAPYVIGVLTRGAVSPLDFRMDAGAERVLHDWLGGAARDIRSELRPYWPINGSVLDYQDVAEHYMSQIDPHDFTLYRSIVPVWDNTARYNSEAFLLHNFTTKTFQEWAEYLIDDAERRLPADRRLIIANAWNEWAEGAHLEPDMRYGYGYLNSIGRALSDYVFDALDYVSVPPDLVIKLVIDGPAEISLHGDSELRRKFIRCIANSTVLVRCHLVVDDESLAQELRSNGLSCITGEPAFVLRFIELFLFPEESIELLLQMALRYPGHAICPSPVNDPNFVHDSMAQEGQLSFPYHGRTGIQLEPTGQFIRGFKICAHARCFRIGGLHFYADGDRVSTIIRYHRNGDRRVLINALLSLLAQSGCRVRPCIGLQDLTETESMDLLRILDALPWAQDCRPLLRFYKSTPDCPDLRSLMLNELLIEAGPDYVGFLDYDDVLFPHAYETLLSRLRKTGKNATFGRVYSTVVDSSQRILRRDRVFHYGRTYNDFVNDNHSPIHSFLLNANKIDTSKIHYYKDMKYCEDYYMTLQIFTESETDWESLEVDNFIGDYVHKLGDATNTLAILDSERRRALLGNPEYLLAELRLTEIRHRIRSEQTLV
jgi:lipopolysaccharide biosynthesis protein